MPWKPLARFLTITCSPGSGAIRSSIATASRADLELLDRDLLHPQAHVGVRAGRHVGRRGVDDRDPLGAAGGVQPLHGRDDRVHVVAGERVARTRPGVREVDVDQCGPLAEADAPLKATVLVDRGVRREDALQCLDDLRVVRHPGLLSSSGLAVRRRRAACCARRAAAPSRRGRGSSSPGRSRRRSRARRARSW